MRYKKFLENITTTLNEKIKKIEVVHNFDYGDEYEIALCDLLKQLLPQKYGICRGHVITSDDQKAGDDIIIYDKDAFPTLRLLPVNDFSRKEHIPVEAVYAYIEVKYTMMLLEPASGQSIQKAINQVSAIKSLPRSKRSLATIDPYVQMGGKLQASRKYWPDYTNPLFGMVIAHQIKDRSSSSETGIFDEERRLQMSVDTSTLLPDLMVLGDNYLMLPVISRESLPAYQSPFFVPGESMLAAKTMPGNAMSVGLLTLLYALDTIRLDKMPYNEMLWEQLQVVPRKFSEGQ